MFHQMRPFYINHNLNPYIQGHVSSIGNKCHNTPCSHCCNSTDNNYILCMCNRFLEHLPKNCQHPCTCKKICYLPPRCHCKSERNSCNKCKNLL